MSADNALQDEPVEVTADGVVGDSYPFEYWNYLNTEIEYLAIVVTHPFGKTCTIANASGTVPSAPVTNILVTCEPISLATVVEAIANPDLESCVSAAVVDEGWTELDEVNTLDCSGTEYADIDSAAGLEAFQKLTDLKLTGNEIESIDVTALTDLTHLWLYLNKLTTLDISNNTNLTNLYVQANCMENAINLDNNVWLEVVDLSYNPWDAAAIGYYETLVQWDDGDPAEPLPQQFNPGGITEWVFTYLPAVEYEPCP